MPITGQIEDEEPWILGLDAYSNHSKMIGWQLGVHPSNLNGIEFRRKAEEGPASI